MTGRDSSFGSLGFHQLLFTIEEITAGYAMGTDNFQRSMKIPIGVQRAKGIGPKAGETWLITKDLGPWVFAAIMDNSKTVIVESVQAGTNITVDDTDPANPIVNGSSGAQLPFYTSPGAGIGLTDHSGEGMYLEETGSGHILIDTSSGTGGINLGSSGGIYVADTSGGGKGINLGETGEGGISITENNVSGDGLSLDSNSTNGIQLTTTSTGGVLTDSGITLYSQAGIAYGESPGINLISTTGSAFAFDGGVGIYDDTYGGIFIQANGGIDGGNITLKSDTAGGGPAILLHATSAAGGGGEIELESVGGITLTGSGGVLIEDTGTHGITLETTNASGPILIETTGGTGGAGPSIGISAAQGNIILTAGTFPSAANFVEINAGALFVENTYLGFFGVASVPRQSSFGVTTVAGVLAILRAYGLCS